MMTRRSLGDRGEDHGASTVAARRGHHAPVLEGLAKAFDGVAPELGELVQEQDPVVGQCWVMSPDGQRPGC